MNLKTSEAVDRIDQIAKHLGKVVPNLISDLHNEITAAITAAMEESQSAAQEEPPRTVKAVLTIPISVKWALDSLAVEVKASVATKTTASQTIELDDPSQPPLPFGDGAETSHADAASLRKGIQAVDRALAAGLTPDEVSMAIKLAKASKAGVQSADEVAKREGGAS
jgi:hypothetical protein